MKKIILNFNLSDINVGQVVEININYNSNEEYDNDPDFIRYMEEVE